MDPNTYLQNPMYFLSGVSSEWKGRDFSDTLKICKVKTNSTKFHKKFQKEKKMFIRCLRNKTLLRTKLRGKYDKK